MGYRISLLSGLSILAGAVLMAEHVIRFGYLEFELVGHETLGLLLIGLGTLGGYANYRERNNQPD